MRKSPVDPNLGLRIEVAMRRSGLNATELAALVGKSPGAVSHWIKGRNEPSRSTITALSKALKVSAEWLMGSNLSDEDLAFERLLLRAVRKLQDEGDLRTAERVVVLMEELGAQRALEALEREASKKV